MPTEDVTRTEILDHIVDAFDGTPKSRSSLIDQAHAAGARAEVLETLRRLSDRRFSRPQDLWPELPGIAIER